MRSDSQPQEIEATLIIFSESPQSFVNDIAGLESIGDYQLLHGDSQAIHDFYLDMPDKALQAQRYALRLREMDGEYWITLKGPPRRTRWGGMQRLEIEDPWSKDTLNRVFEEVMGMSTEDALQHQDFEHTHPLDIIKGLGLKVIQDRENLRRIRNIVHARGESGPILAEMAIDSVVYNFSEQKIRHHEIEIEAKEGDPALIKDVIESLLDLYGSALKRWYYGKLTTGIALEKMLDEGALKDLLDMDGNLRPIAYKLVEYYYRRFRFI